MLLSLSAACVSPRPLAEAFALAAEAGYDGLEVVMGPEVWVRGAGAVARLARQARVRVTSVHQSLMSWSPQGRGPRRMLDAVDAALRLDCPLVVPHTPGALRWGEKRAQAWLAALLDAQARLRGTGTRLALENAGIYHFMDGHALLQPLPVLADFCRRYDLDITLDTCHAATAGIAPEAAFEALRPQVANIHLSDLALLPESDDRPPGALPGSPHAWELMVRLPWVRTLLVHHQLPGRGGTSLAPLLVRLAQAGYVGPVTLEVSPVALGVWSRAGLLRRLGETADLVRSLIG